MASSFTTLLGFNKPGLGDPGWGTSVNSGFTDMADIAIAGLETVNVAAGNIAMTIDNGASGVNDARNMVIKIDGALGANRQVTVPTNTKLYYVFNNTSGAFTVDFRTSTGTGVTVPQGRVAPLRSDGTNIVYAFDYLGALTVGALTLTSALPATSGGTGQTGYAVGDLIYASSTTALSKLTIGATNAVLTVAGGIPTWTATLGIASGGTGQTTAATAFDALKQAATDAYTGVVELATNAESLAGTDTTRPVTPASMRAGFSASGSAPVFAARAWVNFNGVGTVAIRSSGNVTSITDNGTGDYTVNFTTAISDSNYAVIATGAALASPGSSGYNVLQVNETGTPYNTSSIRIGSVTQSGGTPAVYDSTYVNVVVYR